MKILAIHAARLFGLPAWAVPGCFWTDVVRATRVASSVRADWPQSPPPTAPRQQDEPYAAHPSYWAPFIVVGEEAR